MKAKQDWIGLIFKWETSQEISLAQWKLSSFSCIAFGADGSETRLMVCHDNLMGWQISQGSPIETESISASCKIAGIWRTPKLHENLRNSKKKTTNPGFPPIIATRWRPVARGLKLDHHVHLEESSRWEWRSFSRAMEPCVCAQASNTHHSGRSQDSSSLSTPNGKARGRASL